MTTTYTTLAQPDTWNGDNRNQWNGIEGGREKNWTQTEAMSTFGVEWCWRTMLWSTNSGWYSSLNRIELLSTLHHIVFVQNLAVCNAGLSSGLQQETLLAECCAHGDVRDIIMVQGKSYCFIQCADVTHAQTIYNALHGQAHLAQNGGIVYLSYCDTGMYGNMGGSFNSVCLSRMFFILFVVLKCRKATAHGRVHCRQASSSYRTLSHPTRRACLWVALTVMIAKRMCNSKPAWSIVKSNILDMNFCTTRTESMSTGHWSVAFPPNAICYGNELPNAVITRCHGRNQINWRWTNTRLDKVSGCETVDVDHHDRLII